MSISLIKSVKFLRTLFTYKLCANSYSSYFPNKMTKKAIIILAPGAEEMEFTITADILRRAGVDVTVAGLGEKVIKCSRDVVIQADKLFTDASSDDFDCVVLPGGLGGAKAMADSNEVGQLLKKYESDGKIIAAICAAPTVLLAHSVALGKNITSYPSFKDKLEDKFKYDDKNIVVVDGKLVTSRGPGTAFDFGLKLAEILTGLETAQKVAKGLLYEIRA